MENQVSIIINGVRYDAVKQECINCIQCDLYKDCDEDTFESLCFALVPNCIFEKSDKKFEV